MDKLTIKTILFASSITFFVSSYGMMDRLREYGHQLKDLAYKTYLENWPVYHTGVKSINTGSSGLSNAATWFGSIAHRRETPMQKNRRLLLQQSMIDSRLKQIENNLKQEEKNTLNNLFSDYGITKNQRQIIESKINEEKQFAQEYMSRPHKKTIGNIDVKPEYKYIYKVAGIHPQGIKLTRSDLGGNFGQAPSIVTGPSTNPLKKKTVISPPEIKLSTTPYPLLIETATFAHEVGHHASHHGLTMGLLENALVDAAGTTPEEIHKNRNFQKLITIHERQAEILHKTPVLAEIMRHNRDYGYYPNQLFLGHYAQLAEIDELHKLKDKLKSYKQVPLQKIDALKRMNFSVPVRPSLLQQHQYLQTPTIPPVYPNAANEKLQVIE